MSGFLKRVGAALVHSPEQAEAANSLATTRVAHTPLPSNISVKVSPVERRTDRAAPLRVLAFGLVRPYKGVDLLLRAAAEVPGVDVTVAGEFWVDEDELAALVCSLGIDHRVTLRKGYVATDELPALFAGADALALPYRSITGSGNLALALGSGRPVVVTRVGAMGSEVAEGGLGVVAEPESVSSLAGALRELSDPDTYNATASRVEAWAERAQTDAWDAYVAAIEALVTAA
jgi:glycosyltransferase involved in cell wall biosynthesis